MAQNGQKLAQTEKGIIIESFVILLDLLAKFHLKLATKSEKNMTKNAIFCPKINFTQKIGLTHLSTDVKHVSLKKS